jgi:hypothetical protein
MTVIDVMVPSSGRDGLRSDLAELGVPSTKNNVDLTSIFFGGQLLTESWFWFNDRSTFFDLSDSQKVVPQME